MKRLFYAIKIPTKFLDKILFIQKQIKGAKVKLVEKENLHITLSFLGYVDDKKIKDLLNLNLKQFLPFDVIVKDINFFPSENYIRVVSLNVYSSTITNIQNYLRNNFCKLNILSSFSKPHLTLCRVKSVYNKNNLLKIKDEKISFDFKVKKLYLLESKLTKFGPKYSVLKEYFN